MLTGDVSQFAGSNITVNSGTLAVAGSGKLGNGSTTTSLATGQTGGALHLTDNSVVSVNRIGIAGANSLLIDGNASVTTVANFIVGVFSGVNVSTPLTSSATQNSGSLLVNGNFLDGGNSSTGTGEIGSSATYTQNGGTVTVAGTKLELASDFGNAAYQLNGGLLAVAEITLGNSGSFTFNGGTLAANASAAPFMPAALVTTSPGRGAIINTGTNSISLQPGLVEDPSSPGGGLTLYGNGTLILKGSDTYQRPHDDIRRHFADWEGRQHRQHQRCQPRNRQRHFGLRPHGYVCLCRIYQRFRDRGTVRQRYDHSCRQQQQYVQRSYVDQCGCAQGAVNATLPLFRSDDQQRHARRYGFRANRQVAHGRQFRHARSDHR